MQPCSQTPSQPSLGLAALALPSFVSRMAWAVASCVPAGHEAGHSLQGPCPLLQEGDLDSALKSHGGRHLAEDEIMLKFVQIALALHYTHSKVRAALAACKPCLAFAACTAICLGQTVLAVADRAWRASQLRRLMR